MMRFDARDPGAVLLVSCYELGHQPLGLAWPLAFLERAGWAPAHVDLAVEPLDDAVVRRARFVGLAVPMHTALRLGVRAAARIRALNPDCFICFYGLYALLNADYLLGHGADAVLGGEFEGALVALVDRVAQDGAGAVSDPGGVGPRVATLERLSHAVPARAALPSLERYVHLARGAEGGSGAGGGGGATPAGYVEASRGCLHRCLHCPIPPVYDGRFFAVPRDVVLADIRQLVAAGAGHITFGDPDFLNGPTHALKLARALNAEFPAVTFDATTKIEHILEHRALFPELGALGCVFVVSAVESLSDRVLANLEKGHTRRDVPLALDIVRGAGVALRPSFVAFTPWTTPEDYLELLDFVAAEDLIDDVDPVQYAIRLLVPPGSALLSRRALAPYLGTLDPGALTYRWRHPDSRMDRLHAAVSALVEAAARASEPGGVTFERIRTTARDTLGEPAARPRAAESSVRLPSRSPRLTEPWFC